MNAAATTAVGARAEELVLHLLLQILAILVATRLVVAIARRLGQTDVSGEILAGLLLGPSFLGALFPVLSERLFVPETATIFVGVAQLGLVLLMFQIGLEFEFSSRLSASKLSVAVVSGAGLVVPFTLGFATAPWFWEGLAEPRPSASAFRLFFAVAMSITALPILGRIFVELRLSHTRTAALTIGAAAIDDVSGWLLLGMISLLVRGGSAVSWVLPRLLGLFAYLFFVFCVARPLLKRAIARQLDGTGGALPSSTVAMVLVALIASATITSLLGVFAIIGGFVLGAALHDDRRFVDGWRTRVAPLVTTLFLPIFFAYTGLRTDLGTLGSARELTITLLVCLVAFVGKFGGAFLGARAVGESPRSALAIGVCMNTRALMELIALNIGYELGVLPKSMFSKLVVMAVISTFMATPLIRLLLRDQQAPEERKAPAPAGGLPLQPAAE